MAEHGQLRAVPKADHTQALDRAQRARGRRARVDAIGAFKQRLKFRNGPRILHRQGELAAVGGQLYRDGAAGVCDAGDFRTGIGLNRERGLIDDERLE